MLQLMFVGKEDFRLTINLAVEPDTGDVIRATSGRCENDMQAAAAMSVMIFFIR